MSNIIYLILFQQWKIYNNYILAKVKPETEFNDILTVWTHFIAN